MAFVRQPPYNLCNSLRPSVVRDLAVRGFGRDLAVRGIARDLAVRGIMRDLASVSLGNG